MKKEMKNPVADEKKDKYGRNSNRVYRGGSSEDVWDGIRISYRNYTTPMSRGIDVGFRIVRNTPNNKM
jgi:formylglycine-generating enzyme required for sulfatase activity